MRLTSGHRFTGDGLSFIFAIVIGAIAGTILLSICSLLCVKRCCRSRKFGTRFVTEVENQSDPLRFPVGLEQVSTLQPMRHMGRW